VICNKLYKEAWEFHIHTRGHLKACSLLLDNPATSHQLKPDPQSQKRKRDQQTTEQKGPTTGKKEEKKKTYVEVDRDASFDPEELETSSSKEPTKASVKAPTKAPKPGPGVGTKKKAKSKGKKSNVAVSKAELKSTER